MGTQIYILYNFELYKLKINIYVRKYLSDSFGNKKIFFMTGSKILIIIFIIIIQIYTINLSF